MNETTHEFSRTLSVARIPPNGIDQKLEARPEERAALAQRFDLTELASLSAELTIIPQSKQTIRVTGTIKADYEQSCVVTLEPVATTLDLPVDVTFIPAESHQDGAGEPFADELEEEIEVFTDGKIDLGEMVAQQLGITINPYPRKPGVALTTTEFGAKIEEPHPFAKLADVVKNKDKTNN